MEAVIFIGAQASGKSTFFQECFRNTHVRINLDMLKTRHRESLLLQTCIQMKQPFVVDNTNPTVEDREKYIAVAKNSDFFIKGYYFESKIRDLLERNASRDESERVPDRGIQGTHSKLVLPQLAEGFDMLYYVQLGSTGEFAVSEWNDEV
ncbi:ATP-binding protein [bacterium]|nr:ATP-binding protein [bacterium]